MIRSIARPEGRRLWHPQQSVFRSPFERSDARAQLQRIFHFDSDHWRNSEADSFDKSLSQLA